MAAGKLKALLFLTYSKLSVRNALRSGRAPILVHQMGKVGSTSLMNSLRSLSGMPPICQTHFLSEGGISAAKKTYRKWNSTIPNHMRFADFIAPRVNFHTCDRPLWHVVSIVRDPVARQLSDIYQNPQIVGEGADGVPEPDRVLKYLSTYFREFDESTDFVCQWFKREIIDFFGFPVFAGRFPVENGYELFERQNLRLLIIRLEDFPGVIDNGWAIGEWLQRPVSLKVAQQNAARARESFSSYNKVRESLKLSRMDLEKVYSTDFFNHFYRDKKEEFIARWATV